MNGYSRVLGAVLLMPLFETLGDLLEHSLMPVLSTRLTVHVVFLLVAFVPVALAIRFADRPMASPPIATVLLVAFVVLAALGGTAGTFLVSMWTSMSVAQRGVEALTAWSEQSITVSIALLALRSVGLVGLFIYASFRRAPA